MFPPKHGSSSSSFFSSSLLAGDLSSDQVSCLLDGADLLGTCVGGQAGTNKGSRECQSGLDLFGRIPLSQLNIHFIVPLLGVIAGMQSLANTQHYPAQTLTLLVELDLKLLLQSHHDLDLCVCVCVCQVGEDKQQREEGGRV